MAARLCYNRYMILGRMVQQRYPEIAEMLIPQIEATGEKDLTLVKQYLQKFCEANNITTAKLQGTIKDQPTARLRRVFIGAILFIFNSKIFDQPKNTKPVLTRGLLSKISELQRINRSSVTKQVTAIIFYARVYEDFKQDVLAAAEILKADNHGKN